MDSLDPRLPFRLSGRHYGIATLLIVEIAIGVLLFQLAWQSTAWWQLQLHRDSGIDESTLWVVPATEYGNGDSAITTQQALMALEGVTSVARVNQVPYGRDSWNMSVSRGTPLAPRLIVSTYFGDETLFDVLGLRLLQGRRLHSADYEPRQGLWQRSDSLPVLVSAGLAQRLFPGQPAVGRIFHGPTRRLRVVGVVDRLPQPLGSAEVGALADSVVIAPVLPTKPAATRFLVRGNPGRHVEVGTRLRQWMTTHATTRSADGLFRIADLRPDTVQSERHCALTLIACAAGWWLLILLSLAAAGIVWVQRAATRISLHRALGATQAQVRRLVRLEHLIWVAGGLLAGALLARWWLPYLPLPWQASPAQAISLPPGLALVSVLVALVATQAIATWPAHRAACVRPHHVTRKPWVRL